MKKLTLLSAIAATAMISAVPMTASAITAVQITSGVNGCAAGGTYPSCTYGASIIVSGSYFSMDQNGDGSISGSEKAAITALAPLNFADLTVATGSHSGLNNGGVAPEVPVSDIWNFFGNTGMDYLKKNMANTIGNTDTGGNVDMTGWTVTWNGIPTIPMGGDTANFPIDTGIGAITCSPNCAVGNAFTLSYAAHVPLKDASGFGGVAYALHLEGTVMGAGTVVPSVPIPAAVWLFGSGLLGLVGVARRKKRA